MKFSTMPAANALIYGVPLGGSYSDFHKRAQQMAKSVRESLTRDQIHSIQWTYLDPGGVNAYAECIKFQVLAAGGLHMAVMYATTKDIAVAVSWSPRGQNAPSRIALNWTGARTDIDGRPLPTEIWPGYRTVVVSRPTIQRTLVVQSNSAGEAPFVVIEPLFSSPRRPAVDAITAALLSGRTCAIKLTKYPPGHDCIPYKGGIARDAYYSLTYNRPLQTFRIYGGVCQEGWSTTFPGHGNPNEQTFTFGYDQALFSYKANGTITGIGEWSKGWAGEISCPGG